MWGGQKIKTILGKDFSPLPNCGETWELSCVKGDISEVSNGAFAGRLITEVIADHKAALVGERVYENYGEEFPLLIKFLDAADDLSIQVHPNNDLAKVRHDSLGKTEMWYIIQADEGSTLISGFNQEVDKDIYHKAAYEGRLTDILNREAAKSGDVFVIPAGRVHTIGKGLLLAEIQQTSDVTYRIHDFNRKGADGNLRELHIEGSLDVIDYKKYDDYKTSYIPKKNQAVKLAECEYFVTNRLDITKDLMVNHSGLDCFKIYICLSGDATILYNNGTESLSTGEVVLVPASLEKYTIETSTGANLLESYIPHQ